MKKIDYYAQHEPWKMPKWVGLTLGSIFGAVALMAAFLIVHLTRSAHAAAPPVVATATVATPSAALPVVTAPPVQPEAAPTAVSTRVAHAKHVKSHSKPMRIASIGHAKSSAILARHDSASKRKQKDDLDRLLGL